MQLIAVGSNEDSIWGDPRETVLKSRLHLEARLGVCVEKSKLYQTPAFPAESGPDYVNAAYACDSQISAQEMLECLHQIEAKAGRVRTTRWGARTLDLDLLACGSEVLPNRTTWTGWADLPLEQQTTQSPTELILPHPRLQDRAFVLKPLADIAPDWVHPILGLRVTEMLERCPAEDIASVRPID